MRRSGKKIKQSPFAVGERVWIDPPALAAGGEGGTPVQGTIVIAGPSMCSVNVDGQGEEGIVNWVLRKVFP